MKEILLLCLLTAVTSIGINNEVTTNKVAEYSIYKKESDNQFKNVFTLPEEANHIVSVLMSVENQCESYVELVISYGSDELYHRDITHTDEKETFDASTYFKDVNISSGEEFTLGCVPLLILDQPGTFECSLRFTYSTVPETVDSSSTPEFSYDERKYSVYRNSNSYILVSTFKFPEDANKVEVAKMELSNKGSESITITLSYGDDLLYSRDLGFTKENIIEDITSSLTSISYDSNKTFTLSLFGKDELGFTFPSSAVLTVTYSYVEINNPQEVPSKDVDLSFWDKLKNMFYNIFVFFWNLFSNETKPYEPSFFIGGLDHE